MSSNQHGGADGKIPSGRIQSIQDVVQAAIASRDVVYNGGATSTPSGLVAGLPKSSSMESSKTTGDSRVRFSVDENRTPAVKDRREPSNLLLATGSVLAYQRIANSPTAAQTGPSAAAGPSSRPERSRSQTRNRGYSLRRPLFNRNIHGQNGKDGVIIEMEVPESSSGGSDHTTNSAKGEKSQTSVSVSNFNPDDELSLPPRPISLQQLPDSAHLRHHKWLSLHGNHSDMMRRLMKLCEKARKRLLGLNDLDPTANGRHLKLDFSDSTTPIAERTGESYVNNMIQSSRYTLLNFFPRQLFAQFSKLANFYFLTVSILQMIPGLSTTGTYTTIVPLLIFVGISMAKEGYDDIRRHRLDKEENNREALVLGIQQYSNGEGKYVWRPTKWQDLRVGEVLLLQRDSPIPADLVLLHAHSSSGTAYIEVNQLLVLFGV